MTFLNGLGGPAILRERELRSTDCVACDAVGAMFLMGLEHTPSPKCPRCGRRLEVILAAVAEARARS